jgi:hypothetical protein
MIQAASGGLKRDEGWQKLLWFQCGIAMLAGCSLERRGVDACVNPKLLRVKVGDTIFDLPNTVDSAYGLTMDESKRRRNPALRRIGQA